jgi:alpha-beta hydrolase superfamily lysophospholipase
VTADLKGLSFDEQIETIRYDLMADHWAHDSQVVANSYGAYILLHSLIHSEPYPGTIFLISPITWCGTNEEVLLQAAQVEGLTCCV